jgi:hypothetical protein
MTGCAPKTPLVLATPGLNRGMGFTHEERQKLGLTGRLPEAVYRAAVHDGVATKTYDDVVQAMLDTMWVPEYMAGIL